MAFSLAAAAETAVAAASKQDCAEPLSPHWLFFCSTSDTPSCQVRMAHRDPPAAALCSPAAAAPPPPRAALPPALRPQAGWQPDAAIAALSVRGLPFAACSPWDPANRSCADACASIPSSSASTARARLAGYLGPASASSPGGTWAVEYFEPQQLARAKAWIRSSGGVVAGFTLYQDLFAYR